MKVAIMKRGSTHGLIDLDRFTPFCEFQEHRKTVLDKTVDKSIVFHGMVYGLEADFLIEGDDRAANYDVIITFGPIVVDFIENYSLLKSSTLHRELL